MKCLYIQLRLMLLRTAKTGAITKKMQESAPSIILQMSKIKLSLTYRKEGGSSDVNANKRETNEEKAGQRLKLS